MLLYCVTVSIASDVEASWLSWMQDVHIPEVLETKLPQSCNIYQVEDVDTPTYAFHYTFNSREDYDTYQRDFSPALQKDHRERYQGKFTASRTILSLIEEK